MIFRNKIDKLSVPPEKSQLPQYCVYQFFLPILLTICILAIFGIYYGYMLPMGAIQDYDEYFTLDRSNNFLKMGDWFSVYSNNEVDFSKPPLQYWLTAAALTHFNDLEVALRLWPFIFSLCLLFSTALLAYALSPHKPYGIPAAVLSLSGSPMFWRHSVSALLDTGAAFFFTLSVASFLLALRRPKWWLVVAISIGLESLQKAPVGIVLISIMFTLSYFTQKYHNINTKQILKDKHFKLAAVIGGGLVLFWPLLQLARHGPQSVCVAYIQQMIARFAPKSLLTNGTFKVQLQWMKWIVEDGFWLWAPAIISVFLLPVFIQKPKSLIFPFMLFCFGFAFSMAGGYIYPRYILLILPILAVSLATLLTHITAKSVLSPVIILALVLCAGGEFQDMGYLFKKDYIGYQHLADLLSATLKEEETPIHCAWTSEEMIYPGALSYFANLDRPICRLYKPGLLEEFERKGIVSPPYRGICDKSMLKELEQDFKTYDIVGEAAGNVIWISPRAIDNMGNAIHRWPKYLKRSKKSEI